MTNSPDARACFPPHLRLKKKAEFDEVFGRKCSAADGLIVLYGRQNELGHPRLGLVVSRKVGGAVVRNRWKRLLREAFRLQQHELPELDLAIIPRRGAEPNLPDLQDSLVALSRQVNRRLAGAARRERKP